MQQRNIFRVAIGRITSYNVCYTKLLRFLRYELTSVPGVSEVASIGGFVKQYQVEVDPNRLLSYNISIQKIKKAIQRSNADVGGKLIEMAETEFMVRGLGYIKSIKDLEQIAISFDDKGTPILLKDIANIQVGRITSYNVCYTKLLRVFVTGLSGLHKETARKQQKRGHFLLTTGRRKEKYNPKMQFKCLTILYSRNNFV